MRAAPVPTVMLAVVLVPFEIAEKEVLLPVARIEPFQ